MGKNKPATKKLCNKALKSAAEELIQLPGVVGLGIVKNKSTDEYRVALYVSQMPKTGADRKVYPQSLPVPDSDIEVKTEVIEIGEVSAENEVIQKSSGKAVNLGKEPL